jgi:kynureninase
VGAGPGELLVADSTSVNLFKVLSAALQRQQAIAQPVLLSERSNFPTDLYIAEQVARAHGGTLELAAAAELPARLAALRGRVAVLLLTHVNYRNGRLHDLAALTAAAHAAGALAVWDLAHSAGAVPVDLHGADADFAVGCGYKYLNGGPGAPAFVWAHPRHVDAVTQPLAGWLGHAAPFAFVPGYVPAPGITRFQCGTPPVLSLAALECGVDTVRAAGADGPAAMAALRAKSLALARLFMAGVRERCPQLRLLTPEDDHLRGSQVCLGLEGAAPGQGYAVMQALIARGVVGDFRAGDPTHPDTADDILRFGFAPLYNGFAEVWDAVAHLQQVLDSGEWQQPRFAARAAVT